MTGADGVYSYTMMLAAGVTPPITIPSIADDDVDLGSSSKQFKDAFFDGTVEADAITVGGTALNTYIAGITVTNASTHLAPLPEQPGRRIQLLIPEITEPT